MATVLGFGVRVDTNSANRRSMTIPALIISSTLRLAPLSDQEAQIFFQRGSIATKQCSRLCRTASTLNIQMLLQPVHLQMLLRMAEVDRTFPSEHIASALTAWQLFELYVHSSAVAPVQPRGIVTDELKRKAVRVMEAIASPW